MNLSIISNSCIGWLVYYVSESTKDPFFIDYKNPFISSLILDDEQYIRLCENYDYYISLEPRFSEPINDKWKKLTGDKRYKHHQVSSDYPVMFLGDIEIHWIHEIHEDSLMKKFKGRIESGKNCERIFLWCEPEIFNIHNDDERRYLVDRFNKINGKTIFLTNRKEDESFNNKNHIVKFIEEWDGKSGQDRNKSFVSNWYIQRETAEIFKNIIQKYGL